MLAELKNYIHCTNLCLIYKDGQFLVFSEYDVVQQKPYQYMMFARIKLQKIFIWQKPKRLTYHRERYP